MNGFDASAWKPLGFGLLLGGLVGCADQPPGTPAAPVGTPAPIPAYVETPTDGAGSQIAMSPGQGSENGRPLPRQAATPGSVPSLDAVSLAAWNELLKPDLTPEAWEAASKTLLDRPVEAEPLLIHELSSDDPYRRETAVTLLGQAGVPSERAQTALLRCLGDDSPFVRANAAAALASVPEQAETVIPVLTRLLRDENPQLRKMAAVNLGSFGVEAAEEVEALANALDDKDEEIVLPVVQLLGRIGQKAEPAMPKLQQIAFEQEGEIRKAAETAIEQIRTSEPARD